MITVGGAQQFTATVVNASTTAVTWQVNGITGGNASVGIVSGSGLYTAPASLPSPPTVTITAISQADSSKSASVTITLQAPVSVSVSPTSATVPTGASQQFTATVSNTSNSAVIWQVNGITGGNSTVGTMSSSGVYTAPLTVPNPATVTITALSQADQSKSASATVTIELAIAVEVTPASETAAVNTTVQLTATVSNTSNTAVTWKVNNVTGGDSIVGTVSNSGLYTAPSAVPNPATVTVSAVSQADPTKSAAASITIQRFAKQSINGTYAFQAVGKDTSVFRISGVFTADGNGNVAGTEDFRQSGVVSTQISFTGTYTVDANGMGTLVITPSIASPPPGVVARTFAFVLNSNVTQAQMIEFDTTGSANGVVLKTDPGAFSNSAFNGSFVFSAAGSQVTGGSTQVATQVAGRFTVDGAGNVLSGGQEDTNENGVMTCTNSTMNAGSYDIASDGRGTLTLSATCGSTPTVHYVMYVVDSGRALLMSSDGTVALTGLVRKQQSPFALNGSYIFEASGFLVGTGTQNVTTLGLFAADGIGGIGSGSIDIQAATTTSTTLTGSYSLDAASGRATLSLNIGTDTSHLVLYLADPDHAFLMYTDSGVIQAGSVRLQHGSNFTQASLQGQFSTSVSANGPTQLVGILLSDGNGALTLNGDSSNAQSGTPVLVSPFTSTGTYTMDSSGSGRGTASLTGISNGLVFYAISSDEVLMHALDTSQASCMWTKQF